MFRVVVRDKRGHRRELSIAAATEEEARSIASSTGDFAAIEQVTVSPQGPPRLELGGCAMTAIGCVIILGSTTLGCGIGGAIGRHLDEGSSEFIKTGWLGVGIIGLFAGLVCGVGLFVAFLKRFWRPR